MAINKIKKMLVAHGPIYGIKFKNPEINAKIKAYFIPKIKKQVTNK